MWSLTMRRGYVTTRVVESGVFGPHRVRAAERMWKGMEKARLWEQQRRRKDDHPAALPDAWERSCEAFLGRYVVRLASHPRACAPPTGRGALPPAGSPAHRVRQTRARAVYFPSGHVSSSPVLSAAEGTRHATDQQSHVTQGLRQRPSVGGEGGRQPRTRWTQGVRG